MYHCTSCDRDVELPDYSLEDGKRICPESDCGKKTIVAILE